jgi:hypothetical protein
MQNYESFPFLKNLLFEAEIYVPGYAQNAGFCTIYPRPSGGLERPPGRKDYLASEVGKPALSLLPVVIHTQKLS